VLRNTEREEAFPAKRFLQWYALIWLGLVIYTGAVFLTPFVSYAVVAPDLDLVINSAAVVVAGSIVLRTVLRHLDGGESASFFQAAAFLALFVGGMLRIFLLVTDSPLSAGYGLQAPSQGPLYVWTLQRLMASLLLALGAVSAARAWPRQTRLSLLALPLPALAVLLFSVMLLDLNEALPTLIPPADLALLLQPMDRFIGPISFGYVSVELALAAVFVIASIAYARLWVTRQRRAETAFLAGALVVAAFSELHYALVPGAYEGLLTSGDYLRFVFYLIVLVGIAIGALDDSRRLRAANGDLVALRHAEAERIMLQERSRLAREVHDGLAQELWLARLTQGRLAAVEDLPEAVREDVERLDRILDRAVAEARQAVVSLQAGPDEGFGDLLRRFVEDYGDRFGLNVEASAEINGVVPSTETQTELLRICREALNNVHKHADATVARVKLTVEGRHLQLTVHDNGKGFNLDRTRRGFGLQSMQERAAAIGARMDITSAPMDGTTIRVELDT
jgi:signal transduction histidine kinase